MAKTARKVFLLDDYAAVTNTVAQLGREDLGLRVYTANTPEQISEVFRNGVPGVILIDDHAKFKPLHLAEAIREYPQYAKSKVIIMTTGRLPERKLAEIDVQVALKPISAPDWRKLLKGEIPEAPESKVTFAENAQLQPA